MPLLEDSPPETSSPSPPKPGFWKPDPVRRVGLLSSFSPEFVPLLARRTYSQEAVGNTLWSIMITTVEGGITGVIAQKAFPDTPSWVIATVTAAPAFSNITSFIWAYLSSGQQTVRNLVRLQWGVLALVGLIIILPLNAFGLYAFTAAVVASRMLLTGTITLRSVLWRANYPRSDRARITGKIITLQVIYQCGLSFILGSLMDYNEQSFRFAYALAIALGVIGSNTLGLMRVRRPWTVQPGKEVQEATDGGSWMPRTMVVNWARTLGDITRVLRDDSAFRGYMVCMFILGISNLAVMAPLIKFGADELNLSYMWAIALLQVVPQCLMPLAIPIWARLLDRVHIIRFRSIHGWFFVAAHIVTFYAAAHYSVGLLAIAQLIRGFAFGGGALAWNIGHNDFASPRQANIYMTTHVTLTGLRGIIGAYIGILLYTGNLGPLHITPTREYSFLIWAAVAAIGTIGFILLDLRYSDVTSTRPAND